MTTVKFAAVTDPDKMLAAVRRNGDALRYCREPTEAVMLAAVENDGDALRYVLDIDAFKRIAGQLAIRTDV